MRAGSLQLLTIPTGEGKKISVRLRVHMWTGLCVHVWTNTGSHTCTHMYAHPATSLCTCTLKYAHPPPPPSQNVPDFTEPWWTFLWPQNTEGSKGTLDKAGWIPKPASPPFSLISGPTLHGYFLLLAFPRGTIWRLIERHVGKEADAERNTPHRRQMKIIHQKRKTIKQVMLSACLALHKTGLELPAPSSVAGAH